MKKAGLTLGGIFFVACSAMADQTDSVREWLDRMVRSVETLDYRGTVVYLRGDKVETLRVVHRNDGDVVRERIYSLNGAQREVLRDGDEVRCLFSDDHGLVFRGQFSQRLMPNLPVEGIADGVEGYRFSLAGSDRVAGFDTQVLEIFPLDEFRYGHRLWLEQETGMLLRSALLDSHGQIRQQLMFTEIEIGAEIDDGELTPDPVSKARQYTSAASVPDEGVSVLDKASWMPARLPPGFRLTGVKKGGEKAGFEHLLFSDGFASFSVYLESDHDAGAVAGLNTVGAVNVYTRASDDMLITVVGEVPASTVQEIGRLLQPVE